MTGTQEGWYDSGIKIGQALYTWAEVLPSGKQGEGFIAASPSLARRIDWLNASCRPLIGFFGNRYKVTAEQRAHYKPVGRHIHTDKTFVYRKSDVGTDSHNRGGNYLIHFLVADSNAVCLSDVLRIHESSWDFRAARVTTSGGGRLGSIPDVDLTEFRDQLVSFATFEEPDRSTVIKALLEMSRTRILDVTDLDKGVVLGILSVLPYWADYSAELISEWSDHGPVIRLRLSSRQSTVAVGDDRRLTPVSEALQELRERLMAARSTDELHALLTSRSTLAPVSAPGAVPADATSEKASLDTCIEKWLGKVVSLAQNERELLMSMQPPDLVRTLAQQERRLPLWRDRDEIALSLLEHCERVDRMLLSAVMPLEDESVSRYVTVCSNSAVLESAVWLNRNRSRHVEIEFPDGVATTILLHLVTLCTEQADFEEGLVRSVRISFFGAGSFVRRLLRSPGMDYKYLYSQILPAASEGDSDILWALASVNPEMFASWMRSSEIYELYVDALISALHRAESQPQYGAIPSLVNRWRNREAMGLETDPSRTDILGPVKSHRASRRKSSSRSWGRRGNRSS